MFQADFTQINKTVVTALCVTKGNMGMGEGGSAARLSPQAQAWRPYYPLTLTFGFAAADCQGEREYKTVGHMGGLSPEGNVCQYVCASDLHSQTRPPRWNREKARAFSPSAVCPCTRGPSASYTRCLSQPWLATPSVSLVRSAKWSSARRPPLHGAHCIWLFLTVGWPWRGLCGKVPPPLHSVGQGGDLG